MGGPDSVTSLSIPYIAWEIQLTCNMGCEFCYSSSYNRFRRHETKDREVIQEIKRDLDTLRDTGLGVRFINWSGGEPLLRYSELDEILDAATARGFRNILSTNGMFSTIPAIGDRNDRAASNTRFEIFVKTVLEPHLDWLSVSWDSADPLINNDVMRRNVSGDGGSPLHHADILATIEMYRRRRPRFRLKINTMVTSKNYGDGIAAIGDHLEGLDVVWKLIQFNPRECPPESRRDYWIDTDRYDALVQEVKRRYEGKQGWGGLRLATRYYDGSEEPYCFLVVNTSREVLLPKGERHVVLGAFNGEAGQSNPASFGAELRRRLEAELRVSPHLNGDARRENRPVIELFSERNSRILEHSYSLEGFSFEPLKME